MNQAKLGFGLMRLPTRKGGNPADIDVELVNQMVDRFLERGFTYFDTALMYCGSNSEATVKEVLVKRHPRDSFTLATKLHAGYLHSLEDRDRIFEEQRERTGVRFFDYYLLHDVNVQSLETYNRLDCFRWLAQKKRDGLVRHMGFSFHDNAELLDQVLSAHPEMEFVQLQINYLDWDSAGVQSRRCYEVAERHHKPVIVMEPVKGGTLAALPEKAENAFRACHPDWSLPAWALRFAASLPNVKVVLSGMSTLSQVEDNTATLADETPLGEKEQALVRQAARALNESVAIPCTGCAYCVQGCPKQINIPRAFSLYNTDCQERAGKGWTPQQEYYENMTHVSGKASDCIACGQCEHMCPQHLPVIRHLQTVAKHFEG